VKRRERKEIKRARRKLLKYGVEKKGGRLSFPVMEKDRSFKCSYTPFRYAPDMHKVLLVPLLHTQLDRKW
jgi:hypothetical protein